MKNKWKTILAVSAGMILTAPTLAGCELEDGLHNLESSVSVIDGKVANLIEELEALQKEVKALKEEYAKKIEDLNAKHQEDVSAITASINDLKANLSALKSEYNETIASLKTKNEEFATNLESLRSEYETKVAALDEEDAANEAALAALRQEYEAKVAELERELLEDQEQIDLIRDTLASFQTQYEQKMAELGAEDAEIEASLSALHAEYNNKVSEIEAAIAANKASIESLKEEYELKVADIESSLSSLNADLVSLETQYKADLEALKEEYEGKLGTLQAGYDAAIAAINAELDSLGETDQAILERLAALEAKVAELSEIKTYTVTFDPNNGDAAFTQLATERTLLAKPEVDPVKEGHAFLGWFDPSGDKWLFSQSDVKCDMILKAGYSGNAYTITLDPNGGSVSKATHLVQYGKPYSLEDATREGFDFAGWTCHDAPVSNYASYDIAADVTYVAKWSRTFQITFDSDGGSSVDPIDNYGSAIGDLPTPTKEGFRFAGWYLGSTKIEPGYIHESQENLTLKASWIDFATLFECQSIDGSLTILKYVGSDLDVEIPSSIEGKPVVAIDAGAFADKKNITSLSIPASVTSAAGTLEGCASLETLKISDKVTGFTMKSLFNVSSWSDVPTSLTTIEFLQGFTAFPNAFFAGATRTYRVILPEGMTDLASFKDNLVISSINVPSGVTSIGDFAFSGCSSLTSISIPEGVTSIGSSAFYGCSSLASISIPEGVTSIGSSAFYGCSSLASLSIPSSVTSIGASAFRGCSSLSSVSIPSGVASIGDQAFYGCSSLASLSIPSGVTSIGDQAFYGCSSLASISIPSGVTSIGERAFCGCSSLTSVSVPEGVTSIGYGAFSGCSSLASVSVPEGVTSIGRSAFSGCSSLTSVSVPEGVTSIGRSAFSGCSALASISIPSSVTSIEVGAFSGCSSLESIAVDPANPSYRSAGNCLIETASKTLAAGCKASVIPTDGSVTSIGISAFEGCSSLSSVTIPSSVTSIRNSAFFSCSKLTELQFLGTTTQWETVSKGSLWAPGSLCSVVCSDGTLYL